MVILLNPRAGGSTATKKWKSIVSELHEVASQFCMYPLNGNGMLRRILAESIHSGERDFVAAGGDGTVNALLNAILDIASAQQLLTVRLGAIGLGSSNDFHKIPPSSYNIKGIPCRINFPSASARDIGRIDFSRQGRSLTRYFLNNASIGVTAEANARFNKSGKLIGFLKRFCTPGAILATAIQTIASYENIGVSLQLDAEKSRSVSISNLAFLKNPYFTGSLYYSVPCTLNDGTLQLALCENLSRLSLLKLLWALGQSSHHMHPGVAFAKAISAIVASRFPFAVEFDGEVVVTQHARFRALPRQLKVCIC